MNPSPAHSHRKVRFFIIFLVMIALPLTVAFTFRRQILRNLAAPDGSELSFQAPVLVNKVVTAGQVWPSVVAGDDGTLYSVWKDFQHSPDLTQADIYFARSTDDGATWEGHTQLTSAEVAGSYHALKPSIAVNGNTLLVAWGGQQGVGLVTRMSVDGGNTWQEPKRADIPEIVGTTSTPPPPTYEPPVPGGALPFNVEVEAVTDAKCIYATTIPLTGCPSMILWYNGKLYPPLRPHPFNGGTYRPNFVVDSEVTNTFTFNVEEGVDASKELAFPIIDFVGSNGQTYGVQIRSVTVGGIELMGNAVIDTGQITAQSETGRDCQDTKPARNSSGELEWITTPSAVRVNAPCSTPPPTEEESPSFVWNPRVVSHDGSWYIAYLQTGVSTEQGSSVQHAQILLSTSSDGQHWMPHAVSGLGENFRKASPHDSAPDIAVTDDKISVVWAQGSGLLSTVLSESPHASPEYSFSTPLVMDTTIRSSEYPRIIARNTTTAIAYAGPREWYVIVRKGDGDVGSFRGGKASDVETASENPTLAFSNSLTEDALSLFWTDLRSTPQVSQVYGSFSLDGGATWSANKAVFSDSQRIQVAPSLVVSADGLHHLLLASGSASEFMDTDVFHIGGSIQEVAPSSEGAHVAVRAMANTKNGTAPPKLRVRVDGSWVLGSDGNPLERAVVNDTNRQETYLFPASGVTATSKVDLVFMNADPLITEEEGLIESESTVLYLASIAIQDAAGANTEFNPTFRPSSGDETMVYDDGETDAEAIDGELWTPSYEVVCGYHYRVRGAEFCEPDVMMIMRNGALRLNYDSQVVCTQNNACDFRFGSAGADDAGCSTEGDACIPTTQPKEGRLVINAKGRANYNDEKPPKIRIRVDGQWLKDANGNIIEQTILHKELRETDTESIYVDAYKSYEFKVPGITKTSTVDIVFQNAELTTDPQSGVDEWLSTLLNINFVVLVDSTGSGVEIEPEYHEMAVNTPGVVYDYGDTDSAALDGVNWKYSDELVCDPQNPPLGVIECDEFSSALRVNGALRIGFKPGVVTPLSHVCDPDTRTCQPADSFPDPSGLTPCDISVPNPNAVCQSVSDTPNLDVTAITFYKHETEFTPANELTLEQVKTYLTAGNTTGNKVWVRARLANSGAAIATRFWVHWLFNDIADLRQHFPMAANTQSQDPNFVVKEITLVPGTHTISFIADRVPGGPFAGTIAESNENDNEFPRTGPLSFTVDAPTGGTNLPDLVAERIEIYATYDFTSDTGGTPLTEEDLRTRAGQTVYFKGMGANRSDTPFDKEFRFGWVHTKDGEIQPEVNATYPSLGANVQLRHIRQVYPIRLENGVYQLEFGMDPTGPEDELEETNNIIGIDFTVGSDVTPLPHVCDPDTKTCQPADSFPDPSGLTPCDISSPNPNAVCEGGGGEDLPDIAVTGFEFFRTPQLSTHTSANVVPVDQLVVGETVYARVRVTNEGTASTGRTVLSRYYPPYPAFEHDIQMLALQPGEELLHQNSIVFAWQVRPGEHEFIYTADWDSKVTESDESNNIAVTRFTIPEESEPADLEAHDLFLYRSSDPITHVPANRVNPAELRVGDTVYFRVDLRNIGGSSTSQFLSRWSIPGQGFDDDAYTPLAAQESSSETAKLTSGAWVVSAGTHTITFKADQDDRLDEPNEQNNIISLTFTVGQTEGTCNKPNGICVRARAQIDSLTPDAPRFQLWVNGEPLRASGGVRPKIEQRVENVADWQVYEYDAPVQQNTPVYLAYINDKYDGTPALDRNLIVDWVEVAGKRILAKDSLYDVGRYIGDYRVQRGNHNLGKDCEQVIPGRSIMNVEGMLRFNDESCRAGMALGSFKGKIFINSVVSNGQLLDPGVEFTSNTQNVVALRLDHNLGVLEHALVSPYTFANASVGVHELSLSVPVNYDVRYRVCINRSDCHESGNAAYNQLTLSRTARVTLPAGVNPFADVYWYVTPK